MSSGYEEQELTAIDAALDDNPDATSSEVFQATRPYDERAIASVAASRALAGGGGSQPFLSTTVNVTDAQIKALPSTPVEIIATPGAGKIIVPLQGILHLKNWHADYTNIDANSTMSVRALPSGEIISNITQNTLSSVSSLLAGGGPDGTWAFLPAMGVFSLAAVPTAHNTDAVAGYYDSDVTEKALMLIADNGGSGNFAGGNGAQSLDVTIVYQILDA